MLMLDVVDSYFDSSSTELCFFSSSSESSSASKFGLNRLKESAAVVTNSVLN